ncbi:MAG: hypothetical protein OQJ96_02145 [Flavobacteriales bacterium]|nr:hypothetical protein [Flavobacteriales bacterium]MCW8912725.1 hypothetical protein [Flavobacteriales bacterium]MCW8936836.1 hypothetical protein [Flavobacteriales bacterium]MCW8940411.1 hypothetical protein [Flavobacteriales bacterium]MCW8968107.1 hypothetical protein [Flavobacteriales bacterium]
MKNLIFIFLIITKLAFGQDEAFFYPNHFDIAPNKTYREIHKNFLNWKDRKNNQTTNKTIEVYNNEGLKIKTELPLFNRSSTIINYLYDNCDNLISEIKYYSDSIFKPDSILINYNYGVDCQIKRKIIYSNINKHNTTFKKNSRYDTIQYSFNSTNKITLESQTTNDLFFGNSSSLKNYYYDNGQVTKTIKQVPNGNFVDTIIQYYKYDNYQNLKIKNKITIEERNVTDTETKLYFTTEKIKYYYDIKNRLTKKIENTSKTKYFYNNLGQLSKVKQIERSLFWRLFGSIDFKELYTYNIDGNLEKIIRKNHLVLFGLISYKIEYRLEYY